MAKDLLKISLQTVPNGYSLSVDGCEYLYFNETDLLAGFIAHIGLKESKAMDKGSILSGLFSAMMGEEYANAVTTLKLRVGTLASRYEATLEKMDASIEYVNSAKKEIDGMRNRITTLNDRIKTLTADYDTVGEEIEKQTKKMRELEKKSSTVENSLSNSATILKAMEEVGKGKKKPAEAEAETPADEATADTGKGKRGRKKNDEAVIKEIERQAKDNPNVK